MNNIYKATIHEDAFKPFNINKPCCLLHGYGHWTKDCPEFNEGIIDE